MRFVHMADMHFDAPFVELANKNNLAFTRRLEQRKAMEEIINYIKEEKIEYLFIAGDLYEQEYVKRSTIEYLNNLFKTISQTKIFITPGNHDPYIKNSFYQQYIWADNVKIFTNKLEKIEMDDVDIYGYGFNDFYMKNNYQDVNIDNPNKINILITHGSLDASNTLENSYNPLNSNKLKNMRFDYVALGHIHKKSYNDYENQRIVYPGSTVSMGFDELGPRGVIVGNLDKNILKLEFLEINTKTFEKIELDITEILSKEDIVDVINNLKINENYFYEIKLIGKRNFDIDVLELRNLINKDNIIKIKDETSIKYNIEDIANEISLKGLFAKKIMQKINNTSEEEKKKLLEAFEEGMDVLNK